MACNKTSHCPAVLIVLLCLDDMNNHTISSINYRLIWNDFMKAQGRYKYFITVTFKYDLPLQEQIDSLNFLLHTLNRSIFGCRYKNNNQQLAGFVFTEKQTSGRLHFHIIILDNPLLDPPDKPSLAHHFYRNLPKIRKIDRVKCRSTYPIINPLGVDIRTADDDDVVSYLTKTMRGTNRHNSDFISPLGPGGMLYI